MVLQSIAPWFGAKRILAPRIVNEIGPHRHYFEPFCGSLAVLFRKPQCGMEAVNDLHGDLINLARVLASERGAKELYHRTARTLSCEAIHKEARYTCGIDLEDIAPAVEEVHTRHVYRAWLYLVYCWQSRNGAAGTGAYNHTYAVRHTSNGDDGGLRWAKVSESIPAWHHRLRRVQIYCRDAFEMIEKFEDKKGAVLYCDPPYVAKGSKYIHDFKKEDHERLAELLARFKKTRVLISYYDDPRLRHLYRDWTWIDMAITKGLVNQGQRDKSGCTIKATEVLIINGDSLDNKYLF